MYSLDCGSQKYAWGKVGKSSIIFDLLNEKDESQPYAELWMGTHPNMPSEPLTQNLKKDPKSVLGEACLKQFGGEQLPYLFKVLSIKKALSIQAHPNKKLAEKLHQEFPTVYKDPNYKPEMAITLGKFEAFSNFASFEEVSFYLENIETLKNVFTKEMLDNYKQTQNLKELFQKLCEVQNLEQIVPTLIQEIESKTQDLRQNLVKRLNNDFPNDIGILCQYFLNYVQLEPYTCLSMNPDEPHAYISGDCVECMANSDNVVRLGLTPKLRDVKVILDMLDFKSQKPSLVEPKKLTDFQTLYFSGYDEFQCIMLKGNNVNETIHIQSPSILIVIQGQGIADDGKTIEKLQKGRIIFMTPQNKVTFKETNEFLGFICSTKTQ